MCYSIPEGPQRCTAEDICRPLFGSLADLANISYIVRRSLEPVQMYVHISSPLRVSQIDAAVWALLTFSLRREMARPYIWLRSAHNRARTAISVVWLIRSCSNCNVFCCIYTCIALCMVPYPDEIILITCADNVKCNWRMVMLPQQQTVTQVRQ